jgi:hypothetical protein
MRSILQASALVLLGVSSTPSFQAKLVEYDVDGTAKYASLTFNNAKGATEQKQVKLPFHESFLAPVGAFAYMAAQKVKVSKSPRINGQIEELSDGVKGTVHVILHVNAQKVAEAESDAPFGIAKADWRVD